MLPQSCPYARSTPQSGRSAALVPPATVPEAIGFCEQQFIPFEIRTQTREALSIPSLVQRASTTRIYVPILLWEQPLVAHILD